MSSCGSNKSSSEKEILGRNDSNKSWKSILQQLLGDEPIKIKHFSWVRGCFYGFGLGSQIVMGLYYGSNISQLRVPIHSVPRSVHQIQKSLRTDESMKAANCWIKFIVSCSWSYSFSADLSLLAANKCCFPIPTSTKNTAELHCSPNIALWLTVFGDLCPLRGLPVEVMRPLHGRPPPPTGLYPPYSACL